MPTLAQKYENNKQDINVLTESDVQLGAPTYSSSAPPIAQSTIAKRSELSKLISVFAPALGRLTLKTGDPYALDNQIDKAALYWTPYKGNNIALYDGTRWRLRKFSETIFYLTRVGSCTTTNGSNVITVNYTPPPGDEFTSRELIVGMLVSGTGIPASTTISSISGNQVTLNNNATADGTVSLTFKVPGSKLYDVVGFDVELGIVSGGYGILALTLVPWTNSTTRANALSTQNGVPCLTDAVNISGVSVAGSRLRYLGTIAMQADGTTYDSYSYRYIWNMYNRLRRIGFTYNTNASWTYGTGAWRECNGGTGQVRFNFIVGEPTELCATLNDWFSTPAGGGYGGFYIDGTTSADLSMLSYSGQLAYGFNTSRRVKLCSVGYHYATQVEWCNATGTHYGNGAATSNAYHSMFTLEM